MAGGRGHGRDVRGGIETDAVTERRELNAGWELARTEPDRLPGPAGLDGLDWAPARVPGTVAGALTGVSRTDEIDGSDWWFRLAFDAEPAAPGERVGSRWAVSRRFRRSTSTASRCSTSESMFAGHELDVGARLRGANELAICFRALGPRLRARRSPRARWRTRLVSEGNLRFYRTMLLGRAPGFAPGPAVTGPWRPVTLERASGPSVTAVRLRAHMAGDDGILDCAARVIPAPGEPWPERLPVTVSGAGRAAGAGSPIAAELPVAPGTGEARGRITVPRPERWWPHTHGRPALYEVQLGAGEERLHRARTGFRELRGEGDLQADGLRLSVNGRPVFARGAVWTPLDLRAPHADEAQLRPVLERVVAGGHEHAARPGDRDLRGAGVLRPVRRAGDPRLAGLHVRQPRLPRVRRAPSWRRWPPRPGRCSRSSAAGPVSAWSAAAARWPSRWRCSGSIRRLAAGPLYGELLPRLVAEAEVAAPYVPSSAVGWRSSVPARPRRGQLLRRRGLPASARGRASLRGALRRRVPGLCQRARRGGAGGAGRARRAGRAPSGLEGGGAA